MKLGKAVDVFVRGYRNEQTRHTYEIVTRHLLRHIDPEIDVADLRPVDLVEYGQLIDQNPAWSEATRRKYAKSIKTFFNWLEKIEAVPKSPAKNVIRARKLPTYVSRDKAITDEELNVLLTWSQFKPRYDALFKLLRDSGCRIGGAAGLKVSDIDLDRNVAHVVEKGNKPRMIAFGNETANALRRWLLMRKPDAGPYVFSVNGKPIKSANLAQLVSRTASQLGLRSLGPHHFRHRKGHQLADDHVAPSIAATALGHSDPNITLTYYYPADWASAEAELRRLAAIDEQKQPQKVITLPVRRSAG